MEGATQEGMSLGVRNTEGTWGGGHHTRNLRNNIVLEMDVEVLSSERQHWSLSRKELSEMKFSLPMSLPFLLEQA